MRFYDIFNGDADGICALQQLRLTEPREATLVTGVKRDTRLVERVTPSPGDVLTVLDISMGSNADGLAQALGAGARVRFFDHHFAGDIPDHPHLEAFIDTAPTICTSLIVDRYLAGRQRVWAVAAAFGDNLREAAAEAAIPLGLNAHRLTQLRELGELINYNAYGDTVADLHFDPTELYRTLSRYHDPFDFIARERVVETLRRGYDSDMDKALRVAPELQSEGGAVYVLPDLAWSRRVSGSLGNHLAREHPERAHAVLTRKGEAFQVSVRAPNSRPAGADQLCRQFASGGGRAGAAGINSLASAELTRFIEAFRSAYA